MLNLESEQCSVQLKSLNIDQRGHREGDAERYRDKKDQRNKADGQTYDLCTGQLGRPVVPQRDDTL